MNRSVGLVLVGLGMAAVVIGLLVWAGAFQWFGRLPGDIRYRSGRTRIAVPITSSIIVSVALSLLLALFSRLLR